MTLAFQLAGSSLHLLGFLGPVTTVVKYRCLLDLGSRGAEAFQD